MTLFGTYERTLEDAQPVGVVGRVSGVRGLTATVSEFPAPVGASCRIVRSTRSVVGRVVGFWGEQTLVMPLGTVAGICKGDRVVLCAQQQAVGVGEGMLGRMIDGMGRPIDGRGEFAIEKRMPTWPRPLEPMRRRRISEPLATGVRSIDAMLTIGRGQRMGIFSGSGVGKSVLLGMIARYTAADVSVIALVGERGREVRDFVERDLGDDGLRRSVVVVATGDEPPLVRVQAAAVAAAVAEYFRDRGANVLLLMDSLTRLASAQRTVGLAAGEPPATRGFPPSVFNLLPELLERTGRTAEGSITGFYTVLVEGDDMTEPVSDAVRSVTDGHVHLSRNLANQGHYPAVDVLASVSRIMMDVADEEHRLAAKAVQRIMANYAEIHDLVTIGAYKNGANPDYDLAVKAMPLVRRFLCQGVSESSPLDRTRKELAQLYRQINDIRELGREK